MRRHLEHQEAARERASEELLGSSLAIAERHRLDDAELIDLLLELTEWLGAGPIEPTGDWKEGDDE